MDYKEDSDSDEEYNLGDHVEIVDFKDIIKDLFGDKNLQIELEEEEDELSQSKQFQPKQFGIAQINCKP